MPEFSINGYQIETKRVYDVLSEHKETSASALKKLDKNGDKKITEDELVELLDTDSTTDSASKDEKSDSKASTPAERAAKQIAFYSEQNRKLEDKLNKLSADLAGAKDVSETSSILSEIESLQSQIDSNCNQIYQLLVNKENQEAAEQAQAQAGTSVNAASGASTNYADNSTVSTLTTGKGISGGSEFGNAVATIASSYVGKLKETDGSYLKVTGGRQEAWCADFVTYCVKQACAQTGKSLNGFGSPSVATIRTWGEANGCFANLNGMSASQKADYIAKNIKPGDVMIQQNGCSHTGIVVKVYPDGSFDTVEGNTSDQCLQRHYGPNDSKLSGFVKIT